MTPDELTAMSEDEFMALAVAVEAERKARGRRRVLEAQIQSAQQELATLAPSGPEFDSEALTGSK